MHLTAYVKLTWIHFSPCKVKRPSLQRGILFPLPICIPTGFQEHKEFVGGLTKGKKVVLCKTLCVTSRLQN